MTKETKAEERTVKAWGLLQKDLEEGWTLTLPIYRVRKDAQEQISVYRLRGYKVVPCTITYSLT